MKHIRGIFCCCFFIIIIFLWQVGGGGGQPDMSMERWKVRTTMIRFTFGNSLKCISYLIKTCPETVTEKF